MPPYIPLYSLKGTPGKKGALGINSDSKIKEKPEKIKEQLRTISKRPPNTPKNNPSDIRIFHLRDPREARIPGFPNWIHF